MSCGLGFCARVSRERIRVSPKDLTWCLWGIQLSEVLLSRMFWHPGDSSNVCSAVPRLLCHSSCTVWPRTCLLVMMVLALNGVFIIEQPALSWFEYFPRFRELCKITPIWKVSWYMLHYGSPTPKRHHAYSNSACIRHFNRGKLRGWKKKVLPGAPKTARYYTDAKGKKRWVGTKHLKGSGSGAEYCIR